MYDHMNDGIR